MKKNLLLKIVMVLVTALVIILMTGCDSTSGKGPNETGVSIPIDNTQTEPSPTTEPTPPTSGEPTCKWGEQQEVSSSSNNGGYFLPEKMIEAYKDGTLEQGDLWGYIVEPYFTRENIGPNEQKSTVFMPITGGGPSVSPKSGEFYIHPEDQAKLDNGEQPDSIRVIWFGHVPTLEKTWGKLVNANGESPKGDWIGLRFMVDAYYGHLPQITVSATGSGTVRYNQIEGGFASVVLP